MIYSEILQFGIRIYYNSKTLIKKPMLPLYVDYERNNDKGAR
jgi:hypothetical protein